MTAPPRSPEPGLFDLVAILVALVAAFIVAKLIFRDQPGGPHEDHL